jgi:hypothetical protein
MTQKELLLGQSEKLLNNPLICPLFRVKVISTVTFLLDRECNFAVQMAYRSPEVQEAFYYQGREDLFTVNQIRHKAGLDPILEKDNKIITELKFGWHNLGLAADLVEDGNLEKDGIQWSWKNVCNFTAIGQAARFSGLEWGGYWKAFKDLPHVQLTNGLPLAEAKSIYENKGLIEVWNTVLSNG